MKTFWKHIKFKDVMIEELRIFDVPTGTILYGMWWNCGQLEPYMIGEYVAMHIYHDDDDKWVKTKINSKSQMRRFSAQSRQNEADV